MIFSEDFLVITLKFAFFKSKKSLNSRKRNMAYSSSTLILALFGVLLFSSPLVNAEGDCIEGKYHKPNPGPEKDFPICQEYSSNACCKKEFTVKLKASRTEELYNHTWDLCKELSKPCEKFWLQQVFSGVFLNFACF